MVYKKVRYEHKFEDIFLDILWDTDSELFQQLMHQGEDTVGSDLIEELRQINPKLFHSIYGQALRERQKGG